MKALTLIIAFSISTLLSAQEIITFKASDGLEITADLYIMHDKSAPFIVLFHQANWSRGEYQEIAPKLNAMGYNCMAVDQRSGGSVNGIPNKTKIAASHAMKSTSYVDALPDMLAAIQYANENLAEGNLIIWGSSYSSALALKIAGDSTDIADAVLAFAPGEYFASQGKPKDWITTAAMSIKMPVFVTSSKSEKQNWWSIYEAIPSENKTYYLPDSAGNHGSRALWENFNDSKGYWEAVTTFLNSIK